MPDAKRTKRVRDEHENLTLEEHIDRRRMRYVEQRLGIGELREQALELRGKAAAITMRWQTRLSRDWLNTACSLETEANIRESMQREHQFESTVVTYLRMYYQKSDASPQVANSLRKSDTMMAYVKHTDETVQRRATIVDEYLTDMNNAPAKVAMATRDECPRCDTAQRLLLCSAKSIMTCPECGYSVSYIDATSSSTSFDDIVEFSQYSYKRVNHYCMWLALVQGKETHRVPVDIMTTVMADLFTRQNIRNITDITQKRVRDSLRKLRLRKAYDHVAQITSRLSGIRPSRITPEIEEQLKNMFLQMQPAFQRHAPKTRTNFLSYSYVLYRCFQILGLHDMLNGITLLKGRDKLEANDAIFRRMCEDLNWPLFELPPASETTGGS